MTFEYVLQGQSLTDSYVHIPFTGLETDTDMAALINTAINSVTSTTGFGVTATANGASDRVDLFGATNSATSTLSTTETTTTDMAPSMMSRTSCTTSPATKHAARGGRNHCQRLQYHQLARLGNRARAGARDPGSNNPHPGCISPLTVPNVQDTVGGVTIENNVIAYSGTGGIHISGDSDPAGEPTAAVPFYRIVNNTIYGNSNTS